MIKRDRLLGNLESPRITLVVCPYEGEVIDRVTHNFYKPSAVKYMPLGLLSLAANLREYEVSIIDASSRGLTVAETIDEINETEPDILGLSVVTYRAWAMTEILSNTEASVKVVGGPHTTKYHKYILDQGADAVFVGDSESIFSDWIKNGCKPGIYFGQPTDLNTIPLPARELSNLEDYKIEKRDGLLFDAGELRLPLFSSKGCPLRCNYCDVQQKKYIAKSPQRILEEFRQVEELGATSIHILDDAFNIRRDRVRSFCKLLEKSEVSIDWSVRGIVEVHDDVIESLASAGCSRFHVGIEHLDDGVLEFFRKSQRLNHVEKFCESCNKYDLMMIAYFIMGAPGETTEYRERLPEKIRDLGIDIPYFNVLTPLSDTDFYYQLLNDGVFKDDFWDDFARNPAKDYVIPSHRSVGEEEELQACIESYIEYFK
ncbi:MAG: radical SAM protein [Sedimenticola sp.]